MSIEEIEVFLKSNNINVSRFKAELILERVESDLKKLNNGFYYPKLSKILMLENDVSWHLEYTVSASHLINEM
jgi:hypothetical protein